MIIACCINIESFEWTASPLAPYWYCGWEIFCSVLILRLVVLILRLLEDILLIWTQTKTARLSFCCFRCKIIHLKIKIQCNWDQKTQKSRRYQTNKKWYLCTKTSLFSEPEMEKCERYFGENPNFAKLWKLSPNWADTNFFQHQSF